jgi:hypothetical protein
MNDEVYRRLDKEEIATKDHYYRNNKKLVLLPSNHPFIGKKTEERYIFEKVSLEDFRPLNDDEIVNKEHFEVWRDDYGNLAMYSCGNFIGHKTSYLRREFSCFSGFNLYAKEENKFNFGKFDFLKDIEL